MKPLRHLLNPYLLGFALLYVANLVVAHRTHAFEVGNAIGILVIVGFLFTGMALLVTRRMPRLTDSPPVQRGEAWMLAGLVIYICLMLLAGNAIFPFSPTGDGAAKETVTLLRKVLTFVLIPFVLYRWVFRLRPVHFGLGGTAKALLTWRNLLVLVVMSVLVLGINLLGGKAVEPLRSGHLSASQVLWGLPLLLLWLYVEVGLVEEFFFRALLQHRLAGLLRDELGAICVTALVFGLVHAPGMYLRGAGVGDGLGEHPSLWSCVSYCLAVQAVPGFFFGVLWARTRNLWLLMGIHAMMDLLPGLADFVRDFGL